MKPRPCFVHHRLVAAEWAEPLCLLLILCGLAEIPGIAVIHARHVIMAGAVRAERKRLLGGGHGIVVSTLKQAHISYGPVSLVAVGVDRKGPRPTFECRLIGVRLVLYPTEASLVYEREPQHAQGRGKIRVDRQRAFELGARLRMGVPGKVDVEGSAFVEMLVAQWAAKAFAPHPDFFAKHQPNLERRHNVLRYPVLQVEHFIEVTLETVCPHMGAVQAVDQLCRQSYPFVGLADASFQHITRAEHSADLADVPRLSLERKT